MRNTDVPALLERLCIPGKRRGHDWWAPCPMPAHGGTDTEPSWRIRDDAGGEKHGLHVCYGCSAGGGPVSLVKDVLGFETNQEARNWLASNAATPYGLPRVEIEVRAFRSSFRLPAGVRFGAVEEWPEPARRYALETRGVPAAQLDRWGVGYAVDGDLGGRIVIPVRAQDGRLAAYVARAYLGSIRRYDEAQESDGADLGVVFGEEHWPAPGEARSRVYVAEGTWDGFAIERTVGGPIAALRGSQTGQDREAIPRAWDGRMGGREEHQARALQVAKLATFAEVVVVTDPDKAGDKAAGALREQLGRWCVVRRAVLPFQHDPAKLALVDPGELARRLHGAAPLAA